MAWYDEAIFYHIYPLGLAGAPKQNSYGEPEHRLRTLFPWISHIKNIGCNAIYIGPLFESVGHGYETTDYKKLDSRLGTNEDLKDFVAECHAHGIRVIFDGVFNHTGRDFFAFQDIKKNRESSPYKDWYCNVNFWGNNEYNDGFSYENWGGYNLLVKLNQHNPAVRDYICDVIRFWVQEFDVDGIRLDAADVLDFEYMKALRHVANEVKPEFWLMGEVIHGDYNRWVNEGTLHSVTNYQLHKALYSGHNDHNYFEIAHTVKRLYGLGGNRPDGLKLYNFVDNHDVERIYTKLNQKAHVTPVHVLLYTLPGIPSLYYGSEFGIEGRKEKFSDDSLRPALSLSDYADAAETNPLTRLIAALGKIRQNTPALSYGEYTELILTNRQYAFSRSYNGQSVLVAVNNDEQDSTLHLPAGNAAEYLGMLSGEKIPVNNGQITVTIKTNSGDIFVPAAEGLASHRTDILSEMTSSDPVSHIEKTVSSEPVSPTEKTVSSEPTSHTEKTVSSEPASHTEKAALFSETETTEKAETCSDSSTKKGEACSKRLASETKTAAGTSPEAPIKQPFAEKAAYVSDASFEKGKIAGLQEAVLAILETKGTVTEQMRKDVAENVYHDSLINWIKSFH